MNNQLWLGILLFIVFIGLICPKSKYDMFGGADKTSDFTEIVACDGEKMTISCPDDQEIIVNDTFYGRKKGSVSCCTGSECIDNDENPKILGCTNYGTSTKAARDLLYDSFNIQNSYTLPNIGYSTLGLKSDPCPGIAKYASIKYKCNQKPPSYSPDLPPMTADTSSDNNTVQEATSDSTYNNAESILTPPATSNDSSNAPLRIRVQSKGATYTCVME
jgi:hypothetical protein